MYSECVPFFFFFFFSALTATSSAARRLLVNSRWIDHRPRDLRVLPVPFDLPTILWRLPSQLWGSRTISFPLPSSRSPGKMTLLLLAWPQRTQRLHPFFPVWDFFTVKAEANKPRHPLSLAPYTTLGLPHFRRLTTNNMRHKVTSPRSGQRQGLGSAGWVGAVTPGQCCWYYSIKVIQLLIKKKYFNFFVLQLQILPLCS